MIASPAIAGPATQADFSTISQAVQQYFATLPDYKRGDLITQSHVAAALEGVRAAAGWEFPSHDDIVHLALADNAFLATEFSTPSGKKFMRRVAQQPGTFSRLDRLTMIAGGKKVLRELLRTKRGDVFVDYLATTSGGQNLGRMMAGVPHGVDLNRPTGRIYTADDLLAVLEREFQVAANTK
jgi:hypothetical protein